MVPPPGRLQPRDHGSMSTKKDRTNASPRTSRWRKRAARRRGVGARSRFRLMQRTLSWRWLLAQDLPILLIQCIEHQPRADAFSMLLAIGTAADADARILRSKPGRQRRAARRRPDAVAAGERDQAQPPGGMSDRRANKSAIDLVPAGHSAFVRQATAYGFVMPEAGRESVEQQWS